MLYRRSVSGARARHAARGHALESVETCDDSLGLGLRNQDDGGAFTTHADTLVLATGYGYREPAFLAGIEHRLNRLPDGRLDVDRDYAITDGGRRAGAERRTAHPRVHRPRPGHGRLPQLGDHQPAARPGALPGRNPHRLPALRQPRDGTDPAHSPDLELHPEGAHA